MESAIKFRMLQTRAESAFREIDAVIQTGEHKLEVGAPISEDFGKTLELLEGLKKLIQEFLIGQGTRKLETETATPEDLRDMLESLKALEKVIRIFYEQPDPLTGERIKP